MAKKRIKLFSNADIAKKLKISPECVRQYAARNGLGQLVAGKMIFMQEDLAAIRKRKIVPPGPVPKSK